MLALFFSSLAISAAYCAPPGLVTAETIRRGTARGFWPALLVQFGSLVGDIAWAVIAVTGAAFLIQHWLSRLLLSLLGIGILLRLAWNAFRDACLGITPGLGADNKANPIPQGSDLAAGALLSLGNPYAIAFWVGVGGSVFATITGSPQWFHFFIFFAAFLAVAFAWCFLMAGLVAWGRRFITPLFFRWINLICGLVLAAFALRLGWQMVQSIY